MTMVEVFPLEHSTAQSFWPFFANSPSITLVGATAFGSEGVICAVVASARRRRQIAESCSPGYSTSPQIPAASPEIVPLLLMAATASRFQFSSARPSWTERTLALCGCGRPGRLRSGAVNRASDSQQKDQCCGDGSVHEKNCKPVSMARIPPPRQFPEKRL